MDLVRHIAELPFKPFEFHGHLGYRRVVSFGFRYDYARRTIERSEPMAAFLLVVRRELAAVAGKPEAAFVQALINEYPPGAGIGWHRDKPQFDLVMDLSLLAPCVLRFRRAAGVKWDRAAVPLARRSAYLSTGPARAAWEHSITPLEALRYSITLEPCFSPHQNQVARRLAPRAPRGRPLCRAPLNPSESRWL